MPQQQIGEALNYESEKITANLQFPDGVAWSRSGYLVIADVRQKKIFRFDSVPPQKILKESDGGASGLAFDLQGRLYVCESEARRVTRIDLKGKLETLAENYQGKKFNAPNDIVVRRDGHVYFTDPAFGAANDHRDLDFYGVWHISPKGDVEIAAKWQTRPNGIAFSADGKLLYVTDSDRHTVVAFDVDRNGRLTNQRDVIRNVSGVPGGIRTDVDGRLYVAAKGVAVYTPEGKLQRTLLEDQYASNCAFGEGDLESLFITSRAGLFRVKVGAKGALQY
ncbi:MAG TPA: SMP-30/gluconolactonase/LRE family protein [Bryobacteraceae bacterium]|nr:SMP-30/gluconolactonase/LRE family protein [Bryobacteraceae bacterium]